MNYGQAQSVMVLAGEQLGFKTENSDLARKVLKGESLHPMFFASIEREATTLHNSIRKSSEMISQANQQCVKIAAEYGIVN